MSLLNSHHTYSAPASATLQPITDATALPVFVQIRDRVVELWRNWRTSLLVTIQKCSLYILVALQLKRTVNHQCRWCKRCRWFKLAVSLIAVHWARNRMLNLYSVSFSLYK